MVIRGYRWLQMVIQCYNMLVIDGYMCITHD